MNSLFNQSAVDNEENIVDFLARQYRQAMEARNAEYAKDGRNMKIDVDAAMANIHTFLGFSKGFLDKNRPVEIFYPEANFGIKLDNQERFVISPSRAVQRGSMQPSVYAPVTGARTAREVDHGESCVPLTRNQFAARPAGTQDMTLPTAAVDKTVSTGLVDKTK
jgi:hypothetical protein